MESAREEGDALSDRRHVRLVGADGRSSREVDGDDRLFRSIYPRLRRYAAVWAPTDVEPDDLVQEAVAAALRKGPLSDLDEPLAYLRRSIANGAKNAYRDRKLRCRTAPHPESSTTDVYPSDLAWVASMPPMERASLYLVDVESMDYESAAQLLGISPRQLRTHLDKARKRSARLARHRS
jgi:DNA-directed RNA polymerase specialized sigma24 family protein